MVLKKQPRLIGDLHEADDRKKLELDFKIEHGIDDEIYANRTGSSLQASRDHPLCTFFAADCSISLEELTADRVPLYQVCDDAINEYGDELDELSMGGTEIEDRFFNWSAGFNDIVVPITPRGPRWESSSKMHRSFFSSKKGEDKRRFRIRPGGNRTNLQAALKMALEAFEKPPCKDPGGKLLLGFTDGRVSDCSAEVQALKDKDVLIAFAHVAALSATSVYLPASLADLPDDPTAVTLFHWSSELPPDVLEGAMKDEFFCKYAKPGSRFMTFNANPTTLTKLFSLPTRLAANRG